MLVAVDDLLDSKEQKEVEQVMNCHCRIPVIDHIAKAFADVAFAAACVLLSGTQQKMQVSMAVTVLFDRHVHDNAYQANLPLQAAVAAAAVDQAEASSVPRLGA